MSYLLFEQRGVPRGQKTQRWEVVSRSSGDPLGEIRWFGSWRQYTFFPCVDTTFNPACLREIAERCTKLTAEHRAAR